MKRKTTKDFLAESFVELAGKKPVAKITITDITDNCEYSQPTFYNHFKDKYDLIEWIARSSAKVVFSDNDRYESDSEKVIMTITTSLMKSMKENRKVIYNLVSHVLTNESLYRQISAVYIEVIWEKMKENAENLPEELYMVLETYFYDVSMLIAHWLIDDMPCPEDEIEKTIRDTMPEKLKKLF